MKCHGGFLNAFFVWGGGASVCTVLLCSQKLKTCRTKKEGAGALDWGLLVYTVDERGGAKGLCATAGTLCWSVALFKL